MVNAQPHDPLAGYRPRATGLVASALLLVISVDYATAARTVPPTSDREDVSGTLTQNDGDANDRTLTIDDAGVTLRRDLLALWAARAACGVTSC
jgi:hypothetical protein